MPDLGGLPALDVAIGLTFLFASLALIASGLNELVVRVMKLRAKTLEEGIRNLLDDPELAEKVYKHPLVATLQRNGARHDGAKTKRPSYIPSQTFVAALFDTLAPPAAGASGDLVKRVQDEVDDLDNEQVRTALRTISDDVQGKRDDFRKGVEQWYDATMDRVSGWYKRRTQTILAILGVALAFGLNADALQVGKTLWNDDTLRAAVVTQAQELEPPDAPSGSSVSDQLDATAKQVEDVQALKLPLGWIANDAAVEDPRELPEGFWAIVWKAVGLLLTGFAISLGAPFWFDLMGRALSLRASGKPAKTGDAT